MFWDVSRSLDGNFNFDIDELFKRNYIVKENNWRFVWIKLFILIII